MGEVEGRERIHRLENRVVRGQGVGKDGKWGKWMIRKRYIGWIVGWSGARGVRKDGKWGKWRIGKEGRGIGRVGVTRVR